MRGNQKVIFIDRQYVFDIKEIRGKATCIVQWTNTFNFSCVKITPMRDIAPAGNQDLVVADPVNASGIIDMC